MSHTYILSPHNMNISLLNLKHYVYDLLRPFVYVMTLIYAKTSLKIFFIIFGLEFYLSVSKQMYIGNHTKIC